MISKKFLNLILFVFFITFLSSSAAIAASGRADVYKVTMETMELCTDATCTTPLAVCSSTNTVDIASVSAGADIGSWCPMSGLPMGKTYSHYRVKLSRTFTISGTLEDVSSGVDCITQTGAGNAATATQWGFGKKTGTAGEQVQVIPTNNGSQAITRQDEVTATGTAHSNDSPPTGATAWCVGTNAHAAANAQCTAANTTGSTTWATNASADHIQIIYPFSSSWTVGPVTPKMTILFNTSLALGAFLDAGNLCNMYAESPTVTVTVN
jgi:hypothetical protein